MRQILSLLFLVALSCSAKPKRQQTTSEWDYRSEAEKVNMKGCANLTVVLDNWKFAIMTQLKNLLLYDHQTVLPDYGSWVLTSGKKESLHGKPGNKKRIKFAPRDDHTGAFLARSWKPHTHAWKCFHLCTFQQWRALIKSLSDALDDLYKEFNALKERLGELTTRFEGVESFVDEANKGRGQTPAKTPIRAVQPEAAPLPAKRRRVLIRNGRKLTEPLTDGN